MSSAEILREVKALIDTPEKWFKGRAFGPRGEMCALGALERGGGWPLGYDALIRALPGDGWHVSVYNDHPDTTHADIMALFDRAIALAEGCEQDVRKPLPSGTMEGAGEQ